MRAPVCVHVCAHVCVCAYVCAVPGGVEALTVVVLSSYIPRWLQESACNVGDLGPIPGLGRSPEGGHGNPLQYSWLGNLMDRGAWRAAVHGVTKSWTCLRQLSTARWLIHRGQNSVNKGIHLNTWGVSATISSGTSYMKWMKVLWFEVSAPPGRSACSSASSDTISPHTLLPYAFPTLVSFFLLNLNTLNKPFPRCICTG